MDFRVDGESDLIGLTFYELFGAPITWEAVQANSTDTGDDIAIDLGAASGDAVGDNVLTIKNVAALEEGWFAFSALIPT
jgi:hypothetical protein